LDARRDDAPGWTGWKPSVAATCSQLVQQLAVVNLDHRTKGGCWWQSGSAGAVPGAERAHAGFSHRNGRPLKSFRVAAHPDNAALAIQPAVSHVDERDKTTD
jgi:hypothetical protein